jgi:hypothetical protein
MEKLRYHGEFNWSGETYEFWTHAINKDKAFKSMIAKLSKKLNLSWYAVAIRFLDNRADNFRIERR